MIQTISKWGGAAVARRSHKPEVAGSNPAPATISSPMAFAILDGLVCMMTLGFLVFALALVTP